MNTKKAFTLVELLVVMVIIGILASIVTLAVAGALRAGKRSRIAIEMHQITMALEMYKAEFKEYPPDLFDDKALVTHVCKRWPRYVQKETDITEKAAYIRQALQNAYAGAIPAHLKKTWTGSENIVFDFSVDNKLAPLAALCIWLGGFPNAEGKFNGFSDDPEAPFGKINDDINDGTQNANATIQKQDKENFVELEVNRNVYFAGGSRDTFFPCIVSSIASDEVVPYVYFRAMSSGGPNAYRTRVATPSLKTIEFPGSFTGLQAVAGWGSLGQAVPYVKSGDPHNSDTTKQTPPIYCESTKYQLLHPGLDGNFGTKGNETDESQNYRSLGTAAVNNLGQFDLDNLTNFSEGKELKSILP